MALTEKETEILYKEIDKLSDEEQANLMNNNTDEEMYAKIIEGEVPKKEPETAEELVRQETQIPRSAMSATEGTGLPGAGRFITGTVGQAANLIPGVALPTPYTGKPIEVVPKFGRDMADTALLVPAGIVGLLGGGVIGGALEASALSDKLGNFIHDLTQNRTMQEIKRFEAKAQELRDNVQSAENTEERQKAVQELKEFDTAERRAGAVAADLAEGITRNVAAVILEAGPAALGLTGGSRIGSGASRAFAKETGVKAPALDVRGAQKWALSKDPVSMKAMEKGERMVGDAIQEKFGGSPKKFTPLKEEEVFSLPNRATTKDLEAVSAGKTPPRIETLQNMASIQRAFLRNVNQNIQKSIKEAKPSEGYKPISKFTEETQKIITDASPGGIMDIGKFTKNMDNLLRKKLSDVTPQTAKEMLALERIIKPLKKIVDKEPSKTLTTLDKFKDFGAAVPYIGKLAGIPSGIAASVAKTAPLSGINRGAISVLGEKTVLPLQGWGIKGLKLGDTVLPITDKEKKERKDTEAAIGEGIYLGDKAWDTVSTGVGDWIKKNKKPQEGE